MTSRRVLRSAAFAAAAGLAVVACGGSDTADETGAAPSEPPAAPAPDTGGSGASDGTGTESSDADGAPALLQFTAPLVGGGELDAVQLADKPTAFWFWSPT